MKKIISLILTVLLCVVMLAGCSLFEHDYERDYGQVIATIESFTDNVSGKKPVFDQDGYPAYDIEGNPKTENVTKKYTSNKVEIYKSQLVNYVYSYLSNDLQQGKSAEAAINGYVDSMINIELLLIEADKLFDAGILYWTEADVEGIQRSVYTAITDSIFEEKNKILEENELPLLAAKGADPATAETTYPIPPEEVAETVSPKYNVKEDASNNQWFDEWYTSDDYKWYIEDSKYKTAYPGLYGKQADRNRDAEAFTNYFETFLENSKNIIGLSDKQQEIINSQTEELSKIRKNEGIEYVFPKMGKTLAGKMLLGNSYLKNAKLNKLREYIIKLRSTPDSNTVTEDEVNDYYDKLLKDQKKKFKIQTNFDSAVSDGTTTMLYYPSDRYVFVKHILLPFSDAQKTELEKIKAREGDNEDKILEERAKMAKNIVVYPHVSGEDDLSSPKTVAQVMQEITSKMNFLKNNPREAEREFDSLIYKYNTDPGIFTKETGYAVVYKLNNGESETYMTEFAEAARALRDGFNVGDIFYDYENLDNGKAVPYCITDYGIHVMYYLMDPVSEEVKGLNSYVTPGRYHKIYDLMESAALTEKQNGVYDFWEDRHLSDYSDKYMSKKDNIINDYIKEINKQIQG